MAVSVALLLKRDSAHQFGDFILDSKVVVNYSKGKCKVMQNTEWIIGSSKNNDIIQKVTGSFLCQLVDTWSWNKHP